MNVLYIDIDTLNARHMGCYGYQRNTTPNIDAVAKEGTVLDECYCSDAPCLPSRAALVSGMFGIHNGCVSHGGTAAEKRFIAKDRQFRNIDDMNNLFEVFRKNGMYTVSVSTFAERHSAWWFNSGFNEVFNEGHGGRESGEKVLPYALNWLDHNRERKSWFMHFHLWDPHTPIRVPVTYHKDFSKEPMESWYNETTLNKSLQLVGPHSIQDINTYDDSENPDFPLQLGKATSLNELKTIINNYDLGVNYADYLVGQLINRLKELNLYEDTAIIISSDHGENLGELGIYQEHGTADYPTCHIPMIIKWPGVKQGVHLGGLYYNIDLVPTIAELLSVPIYEKWDGESFAQDLKLGEGSGRKYLVISQMAHVCQRSVRFEDYLYIKTYHDGFHLFAKEMLFDLKKDRYEEVNLCNQKPFIVRQARLYLHEWLEEMTMNSEYIVDPMQTVLREGGPFHAPIDKLPNYIERLKKTGRSEGAEKLAKRYHIK